MRSVRQVKRAGAFSCGMTCVWYLRSNSECAKAAGGRPGKQRGMASA